MSRSVAVAAGNTATAAQYNNLRLDALAASYLLAHEQSTPNLTLKVEAGIAYVNGTLVNYAGGNSPSFIAPVTNPRIDALCLKADGTLVRIAGAEAVSPVAPKIPSMYIPICLVTNAVSQTTVTDAKITDLRHFLQNVTESDNASFTYNADGTVATATDTDTNTVYTFTYNSNGQIATVTDTVYTWTYTYNADGLITNIAKA